MYSNLYCKLAQLATSANTQIRFHSPFQSQNGEESSIGSLSHCKSREKTNRQKEKEERKSTLSVSHSQLDEGAHHRNKKDERKNIFFLLSQLYPKKRRGTIGSIFNNIGGAQELVEFGNTDRGRVFEEVKFCELSSQKRIR